MIFYGLTLIGAILLSLSFQDGAHAAIPEYVSASAKDLIALMLVVDPNSRITISEVGRHAWLHVQGHKMRKIVAY